MLPNHDKITKNLINAWIAYIYIYHYISLHNVYINIYIYILIYHHTYIYIYPSLLKTWLNSGENERHGKTTTSTYSKKMCIF